MSCENSLGQEVSPSLEHGVNFGRRGLGKVGKGKLHRGRQTIGATLSNMYRLSVWREVTGKGGLEEAIQRDEAKGSALRDPRGPTTINKNFSSILETVRRHPGSLGGLQSH